MIRLSFPRRGWAKFSWPETVLPDLAVRRAMDDLAEVPGVAYSGCVLDVPHTAQNLDVFFDFLDVADLTEEWAERISLDEMSPVDLAGGALYPWQTKAVQQGCGSFGLFLCDEPGLGKTRSAIAVAEATRAHFGRGAVVIIAPGFTRDVWRRELLATGAILEDEELCVLRGRDDSRGWRRDAAYYFVHYDVVEAWAHRLNYLKPCCAILDEVHWAKNSRAQRSAGAMIATGRAPVKVLLSGTPMDNAVGELWHPLQILCGRHTFGSVIDFRRRYAGAVHNGWGYEDRGPSNIDELRQRIAPWYLRRTVDDLPPGSLPDLARLRIPCTLTEAKQKAHDKLLGGHDVAKLIEAVLEGRAGEDTILLLTKLRKVCSQSKRKQTLAYVQSLLEQGQSVVVFSWQRETAEWFVRQLDRMQQLPWGVALHGGISQKDRDAYVERFQHERPGEGCYLSATYGVLKEGVTLTRARHVVLHDLDWKFSTLLQAERRVHRIGQTRACTSAWAVAEGSFDEVLARLLVKKADWMQAALAIGEAASAADELELPEMIEERQDVAAWAREQLERWVR